LITEFPLSLSTDAIPSFGELSTDAIPSFGELSTDAIPSFGELSTDAIPSFGDSIRFFLLIQQISQRFIFLLFAFPVK